MNIKTLIFITLLITSRLVLSAENPKLVLLIVVDQLRGDMIWKNKHKFGNDGFNYLINNGIVYANAHYKQATTLTAVGHATIITGANAAEHGICGNDWINYESGDTVYSVEDNRHSIIGEKKIEHEGVSPRNLESTTIGDEIIQSSGNKAKVFSVSMKDRGAIILGGHLGKAFWYSPAKGDFVSSSYYYSEYPEWYKSWAQNRFIENYSNKQWDLLANKNVYTFGENDDRPYEKSIDNLGRVFPHSLGAVNDEKIFNNIIRYTPMSDELTLEFANYILNKELLGQGQNTDMLAISFSATDYIGHVFGPNSLEAEDNLLRLDRTLSKLFKNVDSSLGLENAIIILTSDHGITESPEYFKSLKIESGRHDTDLFLKYANQELRKRLNVDYDLISAFWNPGLYLDNKVIKKSNLNIAMVERILAKIILDIPGFSRSYTRTDLLSGSIPDDDISKMVRNAFHKNRSGNVIIVQNPLWYLYSDAHKFAAMHGSPYKYDTHVPLIFSIPGLAHKVVARPVAPNDIASTISTIYGFQSPSLSSGTPLTEVVEMFQ